MPPDQGGEGGLQPLHIQLPYQFHGRRHVVAGALGIQFMGHEQATLGRRTTIEILWRGLGNGCERLSAGLFDKAGDFPHRRRLEYFDQFHAHGEFFVDLGHQGGGFQRMAADVEEVIVGSDGVDINPQNVGPQARHPPLHGSQRLGLIIAGRGSIPDFQQ